MLPLVVMGMMLMATAAPAFAIGGSGGGGSEYPIGGSGGGGANYYGSLGGGGSYDYGSGFGGAYIFGQCGFGYGGVDESHGGSGC